VKRRTALATTRGDPLLRDKLHGQMNVNQMRLARQRGEMAEQLGG